LFEEVIAEGGTESAVLLEIVGELSPSESLQDHGIIHVQLLTVGCVYNSFWNDIHNLDDVGVTLDLAEDVGVVHEDLLLVDVGLVELVEVGSLDDLDAAAVVGG
jgi:hypothetical protein